MRGRPGPGRLLKVAAGALFGLSCGAVVWEWLALSATERFFRSGRADSPEFIGCEACDRPASPDTPLLPASVLVPLKGASEANERSIRSLLLQNYPQYDLTIGVDDRDSEAASLVHALQREWNGSSAGGEAVNRVSLNLVAAPNVLGGRPKVGNLYNAMLKTSHPLIAMVDADVLAGPDFLRRLLAPLLDPSIGLTTTLYRASGGGSVWSRMDGLWTSTTYLPSALFGRRVIGEGFAFGAAIALSRQVLERIGGFEAIAPRVGDDYQLGQRTAALGLKVVLLPYVVTEQVESIHFRDFVSRRARWSRTIRTFQPAGYTGLALTFGLPFALGAAICSRSRPGWQWSGLVLVNRLICGWLNRRHFEPDAPPWELMLLPARDFIAVWVWFLGFRKVPGPVSGARR